MITEMPAVEIDYESRTWKSIRDWARAKRDQCRRRNDAALSSDETAILRGTIQAYKDLLALEINPPPAQPSGDPFKPPSRYGE